MMPRYFFHFRDDTDEVLDLDGLISTDEAMPSVALDAARDCMANDIYSGRLCLRYRIEVEDEAGAVVHTLPFSDAVEIIPA